MAKSRLQGSFDTNALLRLVLGDVPAQTAAVESLLEKGGIFEVADAALIEMIFVLEKILKMDRSLIQENVFAITRHKQFIINKKLFEKCMPLYCAHKSLSIVDCALVSYARLRKAPLYTFDKDLIKYAEGDAKNPV
ncbi:PIN domain-containing protein [Candidatus Kaiserbacteria bacterium]|nr:PIN domain-containing protein [Candidatus Kaiserbacteria bacterium]